MVMRILLAGAAVLALFPAWVAMADVGTVILVNPGDQQGGCLKATLRLPDKSLVTYARLNSDPGISGWSAAIVTSSQPGWLLAVDNPGALLPCGGIDAKGVTAVSPAAP